MPVRTAILPCALLLALPCIARETSDVLIMNNGDRLTCEIKGLSQGVLYIGLDYISGTSSVEWAKVAHLESKQLFIVTTEDGYVYTGTLSTVEATGKRPIQLEIKETPETSVPLDTERIVKMGETSADFWQRFNGQVNFGINYAKGNNSTQYNLNSLAAYVRERWLAQASLGSVLSSSTGSNASTRNSLSLMSSHLLPRKNYFYTGGASFLQSSEQGISLQSTFGGGIGRYLTNTDHASIAVLGGAAFQNTEYKQSAVPTNGKNVAAGLIYMDANIFKFSKTNLSATAALLPALSDPGRVRFNTNASYYIKIIGNLKWNISFYGNWDNRPPPGFSGSDYGTSSGVSWTFGLK